MDHRIRQNEICVVNLPSCGYVFSSSPSCFIAYGFNRSTLEMEILRSLLKERRIEAYEAGGALAPGQHVFCQKICSKIIQSQFCIVLLNNETVGGFQKPNANVHMEYGLMLGFNKYILPFQHEDYHLEFNIAGLDTVKYDNTSFKSKAATAIDQAISQTSQHSGETQSITPDVGAYLLLHDELISPLDNPGDKGMFQLGSVCGFNLCVDFTGNRYMYFGNFPKLKPSVIAWRVRKLVAIWEGRVDGIDFKLKSGIATPQIADLMRELWRTLQIWLLVNDGEDREILPNVLAGSSVALKVFTVAEVSDAVSKSGMY